MPILNLLLRVEGLNGGAVEARVSLEGNPARVEIFVPIDRKGGAGACTVAAVGKILAALKDTGLERDLGEVPQVPEDGKVHLETAAGGDSLCGEIRDAAIGASCFDVIQGATCVPCLRVVPRG